MGVREVVVKAMLSSNLKSTSFTKHPRMMPVDNLTAFALSSNPLAQALWHLQAISRTDIAELHALREQAVSQMCRWAAKKLQINNSLDLAVLRRVCAQALIEYTDPNCTTCKGTCFKTDPDPGVPAPPACTVCLGAGVLVRKVLGLGNDGQVIEAIRSPCRACNTKGSVDKNVLPRKRQLLPACTDCFGIGTRRYSNSERVRAIGVSYGDYRKTWEKRIMRLQQYLSTVDMITVAQTAARMSMM